MSTKVAARRHEKKRNVISIIRTIPNKLKVQDFRDRPLNEILQEAAAGKR